MKKISILSLHLGYGGIEKSIVSLANLLSRKYNVEIAVCYKLYDNSAFNIDSSVNVKYLNDNSIVPNHTSLKSAINSKNVLKIFKEFKYSLKVLYYRKKSMINYIKSCDSDVIISTRDIFNEWLSLYGKDGVLKIGWEHNHFHNNYKYAQRIIRSAKKLDYLVLVSMDLLKFYKRKMSNYKCMCIYIPNCIESIPQKISKLDEKRLISVGRLSPEKGYLDLLKVYKQLRNDYPDWVLDIIGDGKERDNLERYIKNNNLEKYVTLHGFQGKEYIDKLMNKSSIYLMTSFTESFGIVLIEAMSHGLPCIAFSSAEGAREIINSGENGYLIKNRNYEMMIKKISDLIENTEERKKIGKSARESIKKYTSDVVGEEWLTLIEESDVYE
jgi:glycosyltransferase involved in cell wall biosynthesis